MAKNPLFFGQKLVISMAESSSEAAATPGGGILRERSPNWLSSVHRTTPSGNTSSLSSSRTRSVHFESTPEETDKCTENATMSFLAAPDEVKHAYYITNNSSTRAQLSVILFGLV